MGSVPRLSVSTFVNGSAHNHCLSVAAGDGGTGMASVVHAEEEGGFKLKEGCGCEPQSD